MITIHLFSKIKPADATGKPLKVQPQADGCRPHLKQLLARPNRRWAGVLLTSATQAARTVTSVAPSEASQGADPVNLGEVPVPSPQRPRGLTAQLASLGACFGQPKKVVAAVLAGALLTVATVAPGPSFAQSSAATSGQEQELRTKIARLVNRAPYHGDLEAAFRAYDRGDDGALNSAELRALLADARVGNGLTRGLWVDGIIEKMDELPGARRNGKVDWAELETLLGQ